jgi:hypothetical protein
MSEPTYPGDTNAHGDWSQVYTNLDGVARWMAERGYTDAEVTYVVGEPAQVGSDDTDQPESGESAPAA